jgi:phosphate transport system substrate-binding protein
MNTPSFTRNFKSVLSTITFSLCIVIHACNPGTNIEKSNLRGHIRIDGSSTVYPITEAVAEDYRSFTPGVKITIGISGTGGGFNKFARKEVDITDASRSIKDREEIQLSNVGLDFLEIPVAYDGLVVVVNKENNWIDDISIEELKKIWEPAAEKKIMLWSHIRKGLPDMPLRLMGPGTASGTFDHFTEAVVGRAGSSRGDFMPSEDDNVLVQGVKGDRSVLAFFGLGFAVENIQDIKILKVNGGEGLVYPNKISIRSGLYTPLTRKLFLYVTNESIRKPEVVDFLYYYLNHVGEIVEDVGFVPLNAEEYITSKQVLEAFISKHSPTLLKTKEL